ncbi:MAG: hypothetical protein A3H98_07110 [Bacteroidetes bacterium RIFCSPLOWO2_02_FULL_36_8]|nr:MAG: hypothetical protein A3H98_07110 [Bacteroidetes bacterium RIFCSPLOWO2_02_FULL_36_8]OFY72251.1 MAG: hypothetical protein A3G23_01660 [Bacteroidetes bacterium RIFCSPLOWO2_12_FULL_37_12]
MKLMRYNTLITNYLAKCLELSILVWGYMQGIPLYQIPILMALFHVGYLISANIPFMSWKKMFSGILILIGAILLLYGFYSSDVFILSVGIVITASFIIQLKDNIKKNNPVSITTKFFSKAIGMGSAIVMMSQYKLILLAAFLLVPLFYVYFQFQVNDEKVTIVRTEFKPNVRNPMNWIQFFHHLHYFLFCYTFWALIKNIPSGYFSVLFILGWIAYYFMEKKYRKENKSFNITSIGYGHLLSGITVLLMLLNPTNTIILFLWFLTGLGGGTIYMLRHCKEKEHLSFFEDWGHVVGCIFAGTIVYFTDSVQLTLIISFIAALIIAVISFFDNHKIYS